VVTAPALTADMPLELRVVGTVEPEQSAPVRAQVGGVVTEVLAREGADVTAGTLLLRLDPRPFEAALQQLEANLARDEAQMRNLEAQETRYRDLAARDYVTREAHDQKVIAVETARAAADAARSGVEANRASLEAARSSAAATRAAIEQARLQLEYTRLKAPISGRAGSLFAKQGDLVRANDPSPLVVINRMDPVLVRFTLPEGEIPRIRESLASGSLEVKALPAGGATPVSGRVVFLDNAVDQATGTIAVKARFANPLLTLWPGASADVVLTLAVERGVTTVPVESVQTGQKGTYVYVVDQGNTAAVRPVRVARTSGARAVVAQGLTPGEKVVVDGQLRLAPGATVTEAPPPGSRSGEPPATQPSPAPERKRPAP
jgi:multidrug efflux system membrane fusion protein